MMKFAAGLLNRSLWVIVLGFLTLAPAPLFAQSHALPPPNHVEKRDARSSDAISLPPVRPEVIAYNRTLYALYFVGAAWNLLGLALLIRWRFGPRLRDRVERLVGHRLPRAALFYAGFSFVLALWHLPIGLYGYHIERAYGFSTTPWWLWWLDQGRGYLFGLLTIPTVWIGYWLLERSPKRWWLWLWLASIPWTLTMVVLWPVFIAPAYNRFEPLRNTALRDKLLRLAAQAGIEGARVYEVDISRRTKKLNAYVTGLGPTKRIVLWDTTLQALTEDEIEAIMGHEMGHYVLGHVWWNFLAGVGGAFVILWLLSRLLPWAIARFGPRAGIHSLPDLAGLPLAMILVSVLLFMQTPVESALSRYEEHQADRFGLDLTHKNEAMARAFVAFVVRDYADPNPPPFIVFWFGSHPPIRERIAFALSYRPWERNARNP